MLTTHGGTPAGARIQPASGTGTGTGTIASAVGRPDRPRIRLIHQIAIVAAAIAAYFLVRGATEADYAQAIHNARWLIDVERILGIYHEPALQSSLASSQVVTTVMNWVYIWGHWPVIVVVLLWLARRHPAIYLRTRDAMLVSGAVGLVAFVAFPVAPPRLADIGMIDTVTAGSDAYRVLQPAMFTNQFAAMPSLHVGSDLLIGLAVLAAARRPLLRTLGVLMPVAMSVAVVLTANHYLLDAVVGAALTLACWRSLRSRGTPAPQAPPSLVAHSLRSLDSSVQATPAGVRELPGPRHPPELAGVGRAAEHELVR